MERRDFLKVLIASGVLGPTRAFGSPSPIAVNCVPGCPGWYDWNDGLIYMDDETIVPMPAEFYGVKAFRMKDGCEVTHITGYGPEHWWGVRYVTDEKDHVIVKNGEIQQEYFSGELRFEPPLPI